MTRKNNTLKTKLLIIFTVICMVCTSIFFFTACGKKDIVDPTYTHSESSSTTTSEPNYTFESEETDFSKFPITAVTGFTKTVDNSASGSSVNSGIVNVTTEGFVNTIKTLLADADFKNYIKNNYSVNGNEATVSNIENYIKSLHESEEGYTLPANAVAEYVVENFYNNPSKHEGGDDFVYMLNNIRTDTEARLGTAQKLYLSASKTLEAGKVYRFSVWVKTENLYSPAGENYNGANIRITNSINSVSQSDYKINNIIANDWTQYSIYVVADGTYNCTANIVMGLGYGNGASSKTKEYVEGTVYFDDVVFEEVSSIPEGIDADVVNFGSTDLLTPTLYEIEGVKTYAYDLTYYKKIGHNSLLDLDGDFTKSKIEGKEGFIDSRTYNDNSDVWFDIDYLNSSYSIHLTEASYTVTLNKYNPYVLNGGEYAFVSFSLKNALKSFGSTNITVNVYDIYNGVPEKRESVKTYSTVSEDWIEVELLFKNNFKDESREFYLELVIGPTNIASIEYNSDFATGNVSLKNYKFFTGNVETEDSREKAIYNFFVKIADTSTALHTGYINDYSETTEEEIENYNFTVAPGDIGCISYQPTSVSGYDGITSDHAYVDKNSTNYEINTRTGKGDNGSYAGLINTKYLDKYNANIEGLLDALNGEENIQPIMIYNKKADNYGFVGAQKSLAAKEYAKVSVTLKTNGNATAFVYLVDSVNKQIMSFEDLTVNTDYGTHKNGTKIIGQEKLLFFTVTDEDWTTVTFYVGNGATAKNFRVEVWNGGRDGKDSSKGLVLIKNITVSTSSAFSEPDTWNNAFSQAGNPLFDIRKANVNEAIVYKRNLTATEEKFNKEYPDQAVIYPATYVWVKSANDIYAVYNTLDVVETNPYNNIKEDDNTKSGCKANTDSSTFWMSFSSILLAVVLILAIIALAIKTFTRKHGKGKNNVKSQYQVKSRISAHKENQKSTSEKEDKKKVNESAEEPKAEEPAVEEQPKEEKADYVYGDVQDFGEKTEEPKAEEPAVEEQPVEETSDKPSEEKPE